ncbi:MAG: response regulator [Planctomycetes bacterium]|nr:response regulator [Planctomycetota bacterium]
MEPTAPYAIVLCDDLLFSSRITATARSLGADMTTARSSSVLTQRAQERAPSLVIIDLANPGLNLPDLIAACKADSKLPFLVAFGSHVDAAALQAARAAGCDLVLPRSKFVEQLPEKLAAWLAGKAE